MLGTLTFINVILLKVHSCRVQSRYEAEPEMHHPRPTPASADLQVRPCLLKMFKCERNYVIETSKMGRDCPRVNPKKSLGLRLPFALLSRALARGAEVASPVPCCLNDEMLRVPFQLLTGLSQAQT